MTGGLPPTHKVRASTFRGSQCVLKLFW